MEIVGIFFFMDIHKYITEPELIEIISSIKKIKEITTDTERWNGATNTHDAIDKIKDIIGTYQFENILLKLKSI